MQTESQQQILERRKEIEQELLEMLKETDPASPMLRRGKEQFTLDDIKEFIYNEEDNDDFHKLIAMFDRGGDISEWSNVLELLFTDNSHFFMIYFYFIRRRDFYNKIKWNSFMPMLGCVHSVPMDNDIRLS